MSLYIPMGVKTENEIFNGFSKKELVQSRRLLGGGISALIWRQDVASTIISIMVFIIGSVMMCTKDLSNQSVLDQVCDMARKNTQIYPYRYKDEWEV